MKVLKIGASWCPGCIVMKPRWGEIEQENPWLETEYIDYDDDNERASTLVTEDENLPVFIYLDKEGEELHRQHGEVPKEDILKKLEEYKVK